MEKLNLVAVTEHPANENEQIAFIQIPQGPCFDLCCIEGESMTREEFTKWATFFASCPELLEENERLKAQQIKDTALLDEGEKLVAALTEENSKLNQKFTHLNTVAKELLNEKVDLSIQRDDLLAYNKRLREALESTVSVLEGYPFEQSSEYLSRFHHKLITEIQFSLHSDQPKS